jgi:hypothetical protein
MVYQEVGRCPNCGSRNIDYGESGEEGESYYYEFHFKECGKFLPILS